ncbi:MAG: hypothetical protein LBH18_04415, partial [Spirochaetaceae bacterium]|nr:hypothetical protein [Spirochaetaceae bacterium]
REKTAAGAKSGAANVRVALICSSLKSPAACWRLPEHRYTILYKRIVVQAPAQGWIASPLCGSQ